MKTLASILAFITLIPLATNATISVLSNKVSLKEFMSWSYSFAARTRNSTNEIECARISDIANTVFCLSSDLPTSAATFVRMGQFIEGGYGSAKGEILDLSSELYSRIIHIPAGYDLKSADLFRYFRAVETACRNSKKDLRICLNASERNIFEQVIAPQSQISPFVLLTLDVSFLKISEPMGPELFKTLVSHELNHAQFFNDSIFQQAIISFWHKNLTERGRQAILATLHEEYDTSDEFLMQNEFQAYVLQYRPELGVFENIYQYFLDDLVHALKAVGKSPVQL